MEVSAIIADDLPRHAQVRVHHRVVPVTRRRAYLTDGGVQVLL
jgi:hypothetical protein